MTDVVVRAESLSKLYRIGELHRRTTLRESIVAAARGAFRPSARRPAETVWALKDVSFEVGRGEVVGIIGRNGAGKSTLLKLLARITEPTSGRAEVRGRVGSLLEVGTGFHSELTGRENIFLSGAILGMRRAEIVRRFDEIVAFAEVERFIDTPVKHYSTGMYLRLAFAVAAHLEPEVLLVDEVLAVGDAAFQKKCLGKMSDVARGGRTVLFVSHNLAAVSRLCRTSVLLEGGRLAESGETDRLIGLFLAAVGVAHESDLSREGRRQGAGRARFTHIRFLGEGGQELERGVSGRTLHVELGYVAAGAASLLNVRASLAFYDHQGQALFNCSSELTNAETLVLPPTGSFVCRIPRLPLSGGLYFVSPFLEVNRDVEDWITPGLPFEVLDGDYYGTGRLYPEGWRGKGVLVPHDWICSGVGEAVADGASCGAESRNEVR
jgi:lipopolysaccharide transport system ATP-binding protein